MENIVSIIISFLSDQNPVILLLYGLSVLCLAAVLDRIFFWLSMAIRHKPIPPQAAVDQKKKLRKLGKKIARRKRRHYLQQIILAAAEKPDSPDYLNHIASEQIERMSARIGMLDLIARVAPLVGILGTVTGMATSFGGIGQIVTASPAAISLGISVALQTTAWGLIISLFASVASAVFRKFTSSATLKIGRIVCELGYSK